MFLSLLFFFEFSEKFLFLIFFFFLYFLRCENGCLSGWTFKHPIFFILPSWNGQLGF